MKAVLTAVLALAIPSQAMAWGADAQIRRAVASGQRVRIGHEQSWDGMCQSTGAEITVTAQPQHGTLSQEQVPSVIHSKGSCKGARTTALDVFYTPQRGYQGPDHVSFDTAFGNGMSRHVDADLSVVSAFVPVQEGQVFRREPAPGSLNGHPGMRVFVDDQSCPTGEIKQLVLGDFRKGVSRTVSCVAR